MTQARSCIGTKWLGKPPPSESGRMEGLSNDARFGRLAYFSHLNFKNILGCQYWKVHLSLLADMTGPVLTVSIVLFKNDPAHVEDICHCFTRLSFDFAVYFLDNSPGTELEYAIPGDNRFHYERSTENLGYGRGHNRIIFDHIDEGTYHLVVNADVFFKEGVLEEIKAFMDDHESVGQLMPRVLNPDGTDQYLYKLLPSPAVMLLRRFCPSLVQNLFADKLEEYEMSFAHPDGVFEAPYLSGCFMWFRKAALKELGGFDDRYFLYFEDVDLARKIGSRWQLLYYGDTSIFHYFQRGSYGRFKLMLIHLRSAIKYFNKYGWFDSERKRINADAKKKYQLRYSLNKVTKAVSLL